MISRKVSTLQNALAVLLMAALAGPALAAHTRKRQALERSINDPSVISARLTQKDRLDIFSEAWETINDKYYDPGFNGVNWRAVRERYRPAAEAARTDDDFYVVMKKMVGELRDAHTRFATPRERMEREQLKSITAGVSISEVEGRPVIVGVEPNSEAARMKVEPGMIVLSIDGKPIAERLAEAQARVAGTSTERAIKLRVYRQLVEGDPGKPLRLALERADGSRLEVGLTRRVVSDVAQVISRRLPSGVGYVRLTLWKSPAHKEFKRALETLKDAPGIIVDLRGNPGGEAQEVVKIASYFFNARVSFGQFISRGGKSFTLYTDRDDQVYSGPLVILANEGSGSGSELFSAAMQENGRAAVVGRQSCGCVLGIAHFKKLKGGSELAVSELKYVSPQGNKIEGAGVTPNRAVPLTLADLQHRRDAALEAAESTLRSSGANVRTQ
ncbi:MAG TPA: S41 family peptidase [Blastocatellia bacterium]|nr:S41 family peptidase [Blastocatellia bacterium]